MRDKKSPNGKFSYQSILTGEYVMAHQWIAEVLVQRKAKRDKVALPDKFWKDKDSIWSKELKKQVQQAAKLIKKYSEEAVLNFLKNNQYKFSLFPKDNVEKIKDEQNIIDSRVQSTVETHSAFEYIQPRKHKKSLLGKLNGKKES